MQELQSRNDIIITDAGKNRSAVISDVEYYLKEAQRQLNSKDSFKIIKYNPTTANKKTASKVVSRFQKENLLTNDISEGFKAENPQKRHIFTCIQKYINRVILEDL